MPRSDINKASTTKVADAAVRGLDPCLSEAIGVPMISKAQVMTVAAGDAWLATGANLLLFGPPGGGKSHLAAATGLALVENGWKVLFTRTTDLVQKLQVARRDQVAHASAAATLPALA